MGLADADDFGKQDIKVALHIHLRRIGQGVRPADVGMDLCVADVPHGLLKMRHRTLERLVGLRPTVVGGNLIEGIEAKERRDVVHDDAHERRRRDVVAIGVSSN